MMRCGNYLEITFLLRDISIKNFSSRHLWKEKNIFNEKCQSVLWEKCQVCDVDDFFTPCVVMKKKINF